MGMGLIFPSLPERDEGQGLFRLIGLAGRLADFQETAPGIKDRTPNRHWWTGRAYQGA